MERHAYARRPRPRVEGEAQWPRQWRREACSPQRVSSWRCWGGRAVAAPGCGQLSDLISKALARGPGVGIFGFPGYFRTLPESTWSC